MERDLEREIVAQWHKQPGPGAPRFAGPSGRYPIVLGKADPDDQQALGRNQPRQAGKVWRGALDAARARPLIVRAATRAQFSIVSWGAAIAKVVGSCSPWPTAERRRQCPEGLAVDFAVAVVGGAELRNSDPGIRLG